MRKKIKFILVLIILFNIFTAAAYGDNMYKKHYIDKKQSILHLKPVYDIPTDKVFNITFNRAFDFYSIGRYLKIYRIERDENYEMTGSHFILNEIRIPNEKTVSIYARDGLEKNTEYVLEIRKDVEDRNGVKLTYEVWLPFYTGSKDDYVIRDFWGNPIDD